MLGVCCVRTHDSVSVCCKRVALYNQTYIRGVCMCEYMTSFLRHLKLKIACDSVVFMSEAGGGGRGAASVTNIHPRGPGRSVEPENLLNLWNFYPYAWYYVMLMCLCDCVLTVECICVLLWTGR